MEDPEPVNLCQYSKNKENRLLSIVQMGLFVDREGIPISMCIDPGNTNCLAVNAGQRNFRGKKVAKGIDRKLYYAYNTVKKTVLFA